MSAAAKCQHCQDTGMLPGSHDLDCANCGAAGTAAGVVTLSPAS